MREDMKGRKAKLRDLEGWSRTNSDSRLASKSLSPSMNLKSYQARLQVPWSKGLGNLLGISAVLAQICSHDGGSKHRTWSPNDLGTILHSASY